MNLKNHTIHLLAALAVLALAAPCSASSITVSSIGPGGLSSSSSAYRNQGTMSHLSPPGTATTAAYRHSGGYLHALAGTGGLLPAISFSPTDLLFTGFEGAADPAAQPLNISNSGGSTLAWSAAKSASWLTITPTSGSDAGQIIVAAAVAGLPPGTYTDTITISGTGAKAVSVGVTLTVGALHTLSLNFSGNGSGIVTSTPGGIATNTNTSAAFGGEVTLHAAAADGSAFTGWSGDCTGAAVDCTVQMDSDKVIIATFTHIAQDIRIMRGTPIYFTGLQSAYDGALTGETIQAANIYLSGPLDLNLAKTVTISGGYTNNFTSRSGSTTLDGPVTVRSGKLIVDQLVIR